MALLMIEHEGEPLAAGIIAAFGRGSWSLMCGSSGLPPHRKLRPNYLLQWESMRWAKARGAEYYDFRGIPDVLEPGEEMYGVYEFKRGFGGAVQRVIPTQDLVLRPAIYWPYTAAVSWRRRGERRARRRFEAERERERAKTAGAGR
jgi:lipid II:glycine glycyltransferase (peptidoglycan interpeptide bridge formation enzyme)